MYISLEMNARMDGRRDPDRGRLDRVAERYSRDGDFEGFDMANKYVIRFDVDLHNAEKAIAALQKVCGYSVQVTLKPGDDDTVLGGAISAPYFKPEVVAA